MKNTEFTKIDFDDLARRVIGYMRLKLIARSAPACLNRLMVSAPLTNWRALTCRFKWKCHCVFVTNRILLDCDYRLGLRVVDNDAARQRSSGLLINLNVLNYKAALDAL